MKALALAAEYLDAVGRAPEAAALLRFTVEELMDDAGGWLKTSNVPGESRTAHVASSSVVRTTAVPVGWSRDGSAGPMTVSSSST